jgi:hypothetical protein
VVLVRDVIGRFGEVVEVIGLVLATLLEAEATFDHVDSVVILCRSGVSGYVADDCSVTSLFFMAREVSIYEVTPSYMRSRRQHIEGKIDRKSARRKRLCGA